MRCDGDVLVLAVPNAVACERIRSSYTGMLTDLLHDATGRELAVELVVDATERRDEPVVMSAPAPIESIVPTAVPGPLPGVAPGVVPGPPRRHRRRGPR